MPVAVHAARIAACLGNMHAAVVRLMRFCFCWHCPRAAIEIPSYFCFCRRRSTSPASLHLRSTCHQSRRERGPNSWDYVLTPRLVIFRLYQVARSQPAMPDNQTGIATSSASSQHSNSNNHSRSNNAHLNKLKLKRRSHLSSNLINSSNNSSSNKEFRRQRFHSSQWTNKRISEHSRLHQTNRMVAATSSHLLGCGLTVKRLSRTMVLVALHSALPMARKRKAVDSRRNSPSERPAMHQHKPNKPL
jgi:hypothetical protein